MKALLIGVFAIGQSFSALAICIFVTMLTKICENAMGIVVSVFCCCRCLSVGWSGAQRSRLGSLTLKWNCDIKKLILPVTFTKDLFKFILKLKIGFAMPGLKNKMDILLMPEMYLNGHLTSLVKNIWMKSCTFLLPNLKKVVESMKGQELYINML